MWLQFPAPSDGSKMPITAVPENLNPGTPGSDASLDTKHTYSKQMDMQEKHSQTQYFISKIKINNISYEFPIYSITGSTFLFQNGAVGAQYGNIGPKQGKRKHQVPQFHVQNLG